jgi:hypothetical protein
MADDQTAAKLDARSVLLAAASRSPEIAESADAYGWLVGSWGKDVVQIGTRPNGTIARWMFSEISNDSFRWTGEALNPDGRTWTLEGEFRARRMR